MTGWEIEYYDDDIDEFVALAGQIEQVYDEQNGDSYASFYIPNTAANRTIVAADKTAAVYFGGNPIYVGVLSAVEYGRTRIKCTIYDEVFHLLDVAEPMGNTTMAFYDQTPADDILADVVSGTDVTVAACPSTAITCVLDLANRLDVAHFIADALGKDIWSDSGALTISIGDRGSAKSLSVFTVSRRGIDRSKKRDKVIVKGVDKDGIAIQGSAGTGTNVRVYREKTASDTGTLNALAAKHLAELNTESSGAPIETDISHGAGLSVGDTVSITKALFALSGSYKIVQITKHETKVSLQLDRLRTPIDKAVADLDKYNDLGIYSTGSQNPWSLTLQGLVGLYHLTDGIGTTAKDSSESANNGDITNGFWVDGVIAGTKVLNFDATGYVDLGTTFDVGGLTNASLGIWLSAEYHFADGNYMICKNGQIAIQHYGMDDRIRFGIYIGGWQWVTSDANISPLYGRTFACGVYDGTNLLLYINGRLHKTQARTGGTAAIDTGLNNTYIGAKTVATGFFHGVLAEAMLWTRSLSAQEVLELYFFPLARMKQGGTTTTWALNISLQYPQAAGYTAPTTTPAGGTYALASGTGQQVTAAGTTDFGFQYWLLDNVNVGSANPYTVAAQEVGTSHSLVAVFDWVGQLPPNRCGLLAVVDGGSTTPPHISETVACGKTPTASETISEIPTCGTTPMASEIISETGAAHIGAVEDSYATTNRDEGHNLQAVHPSLSATPSASFQSFAVGATPRILYCVDVYLRKAGSPTGNLWCAVYTHSGVYGTSSVPDALVELSGTPLSMASLTTSDVLYRFCFSGATTLSASTNYVVVLYVDAGASVSGVNYLIVGRDGSAPSHGGNGGQYASSAWAAQNTKDMVFYVYY